MNPILQALTREAGLAAEHMAIGVTALGRANYAEHAYYGQAFFALTIGLERSAKLALIVNHAVETGGTFPTTEEIRNYAHNLKGLLESADQIARNLGLTEAQDRLPRSVVHEKIIAILTDFANNLTRYYNINLVTGDPRSTANRDPVGAWFEGVTLPILAEHYKERHRARDQQRASLFDHLASDHTLVLYHKETGEVIDTVYDASMQSAVSTFARPYERLYVLQIIRFMARLLSELGSVAQSKRLEQIPYLSDFFRIFNNEDKYLKNRKTWSIYRP